MRHVATITFIASLTGLSSPVFSFPAIIADAMDTSASMRVALLPLRTAHPAISGFDQQILTNKQDTAHIFSIFRNSNLFQPVYIVASGAEATGKSAIQPVIQGNEIQDERMEFEEQATRREFGDESNQEEFKEQAVRKEFGGQTKFAEPVPEAGKHDR